jgi:hypothetical protein
MLFNGILVSYYTEIFETKSKIICKVEEVVRGILER